MNLNMYGKFDKKLFDASKSDFDSQIEKRVSIKREDKVALGRSVSNIENKTIYSFLLLYLAKLLQHAEKTI